MSDEDLSKNVTESAFISERLMEMRSMGYTEIVLKNPTTGEERTIDMDARRF